MGLVCLYAEGVQLRADNADGVYGNFAGRDASRGMAKQSFDDGRSLHEAEKAGTDLQIC